MKRLFVYLVLLVAMAGFASAQLVLSDVKLGSDSFVKSNPREHNDQLYTTSTTFTISNQGNTSISNIVLTSNAASEFNVSFFPKTISNLNAFSSQTVSIKAVVPTDLSTFFQSRSNPETDRAQVIGNILATASGGVTGQSTLSMQAKNMLVLDHVYVTINAGSKKSYKDGDTVESIRPGDKLTVEVKVKNKNPTNENVDMDSVEVDLTSDNSDFDIDDTLDFGTVSSGKDKTKSLTYTVDSSIDEDTFTVTFLLTGQDDFNSNQGELWSVDFEIKKQDEDIGISNAFVSPDTVKCDRDATISARLDNVGSEDTDQIVFEWQSDALGIKNQKLRINLNSGDSTTVTTPISIDPSQKAGSYIIKLMTFFDYTRFQDQDINNYQEVTLNVQDCVSKITCYDCVDGVLISNDYQSATCPTGTSLTPPVCQKPRPQQNTTVITPTPTTTPVTPTTGNVPATVTYRPASNDVLYISLVVLGYVVVIVIGIALISYIVRRR